MTATWQMGMQRPRDLLRPPEEPVAEAGRGLRSAGFPPPVPAPFPLSQQCLGRAPRSRDPARALGQRVRTPVAAMAVRSASSKKQSTGHSPCRAGVAAGGGGIRTASLQPRENGAAAGDAGATRRVQLAVSRLGSYKWSLAGGLEERCAPRALRCSLLGEGREQPGSCPRRPGGPSQQCPPCWPLALPAPASSLLLVSARDFPSEIPRERPRKTWAPRWAQPSGQRQWQQGTSRPPRLAARAGQGPAPLLLQPP